MDNPTGDNNQGFQSTLSMRRATTGSPYFAMVQSVFQSTLSMRRATRWLSLGDAFPVRISIHALHEESDEMYGITDEQLEISIHALHEESDELVGFGRGDNQRFQSTLSMRRATCRRWPSISTSSEFQSTLSMRRATVQLDIFVRFLRRKPAA